MLQTAKFKIYYWLASETKLNVSSEIQNLALINIQKWTPKSQEAKLNI